MPNDLSDILQLRRRRRNLPAWLLTPGGYEPAFALDFQRNRAYAKNVGVRSCDSFVNVTNSGGTILDAQGNVTPAASNKLRRSNLGLFCEGARTNSIRNATMVGASAPSTLPTNFAVQSGNGLTFAPAPTPTGTEYGMTYFDLDISGTPSATTNARFRFEAINQIVASQGQRWTESFFARIVGGNKTNITSFVVTMAERNAGGTNTAAVSSGNQLSSLTGSLFRFHHSGTLAQADTAFIVPEFSMGCTSGQAISIRIRLYVPQCELQPGTGWSLPTTPILSNGSAVTRTLDNISLKSEIQAACGLSLAQGTWFVEWEDLAGPVGAIGVLVRQRVDGTAFIQLIRQSNNRAAFSTVVASSNTALITPANSIAANTPYKAAAAYATDDVGVRFTASLGSDVANDTSAAMPTGAFTTAIGFNGVSGDSAHALIKRIFWFPDRIPDSILPGMVAA